MDSRILQGGGKKCVLKWREFREVECSRSVHIYFLRSQIPIYSTKIYIIFNVECPQ